MSEHKPSDLSPLPWAACSRRDTEAVVMDANGRWVANVGDQEDAAFIVSLSASVTELEAVVVATRADLATARTELTRAEGRETSHLIQIADLRQALERSDSALSRVGAVLADVGCDCDTDDPHEGRPCEELGHAPCLACRFERALGGAR